MTYAATPHGWTRVYPNEWFETRKPPLFQCETRAGKQYIFDRPEEDGTSVYCLELQGWGKPFYRNYDLMSVVEYAKCCEGTDLLRIGKLDRVEFASTVYTCVVIALEGLITGTYASAEASREAIAKAELLFHLLRDRLSDKIPKESLAAQAERLAAKFVKAVFNFYKYYVASTPELCLDSLDEMQSIVDVMRKALDAVRKISPKGSPGLQ